MKTTLWPYAIVLSFVGFIGYISFFAFQAFQHDVNLVEDDYYAQELAYDAKMLELKNSRAFEKSFKVHKNTITATTSVALDAFFSGAEAKITMYRPSSQKNDQKFEVKLDENAAFGFKYDKLKTGRWIIQIKINKDSKNYFFEKPIDL